MILALPMVDVEAIKAKDFKVVVDAVNSTGGIAVPMLLKAFGSDRERPVLRSANRKLST